jgi:prepilin-type N-terminal cleavage/methylation domain-containing protein
MKGERGFTLIEVLVALGIAAGALLLLLSANNGSLRKSMGAREDLRVLRSAESKYEECLLGIEPGVSGELGGLEGWRWEVFRNTTYVAQLKKLKRVQFVVYRPEGQKAFEWGGIRESE